GEYITALKEAVRLSSQPKVILLLGANIGNMPPAEADNFCSEIRQYLSPNDLAIIGFDLKKHPWVIFKAYNDPSGITRQFNLNLLERINRELYADFKTEQFDHYESYDPETGACRSYLISLKDQEVTIGDTIISFAANEYIFTETSHKYTVEETDRMAIKSGFKPLAHLFDSKKWFTDVIWEAV
ncbi:MAG TPA: L-histidine N(alpha)-methyltransferase, partial [Pedobacter sp.]